MRLLAVFSQRKGMFLVSCPCGCWHLHLADGDRSCRQHRFQLKGWLLCRYLLCRGASASFRFLSFRRPADAVRGGGDSALRLLPAHRKHARGEPPQAHNSLTIEPGLRLRPAVYDPTSFRLSLLRDRRRKTADVLSSSGMLGPV